MIVKAIRTDKVTAAAGTIFEFLDKNLPALEEESIVVVTSKIIALCEGRTVDANADKDELVRAEADYVLPDEFKDSYIALTIKDNTLVPAAGIDQSNSDGDYVLWPANSIKTASEIRAYLKKRFGLGKVGVLVTDSGAMPLRFGTMGIVLGYSGFSPFHDYKMQKEDLFGYPLKAGRANLAGGLAAAAVTVMGEGIEQTPLAVVSEVPFVNFTDEEPSAEELANYFIAPENDRLFAAFFKGIDWQSGQHKKH